MSDPHHPSSILPRATRQAHLAMQQQAFARALLAFDPNGARLIEAHAALAKAFHDRSPEVENV